MIAGISEAEAHLYFDNTCSVRFCQPIILRASYLQ